MSTAPIQAGDECDLAGPHSWILRYPQAKQTILLDSSHRGLPRLYDDTSGY
jgi:hypothetical protein